jgi:hypothetical protein
MCYEVRCKESFATKKALRGHVSAHHQHVRTPRKDTFNDATTIERIESSLSKAVEQLTQTASAVHVSAASSPPPISKSDPLAVVRNFGETAKGIGYNFLTDKQARERALDLKAAMLEAFTAGQSLSTPPSKRQKRSAGGRHDDDIAEAERRFCTTCGAQYSASSAAAFCARCGRPLPAIII